MSENTAKRTTCTASSGEAPGRPRQQQALERIADAQVRVGTEQPAITRADVLSAARRLDGVTVRTPVLTSAALDERAGAEVFLKCEGLQRTGAFKLRGATNALALLSAEELARGVLTYSSGNHGRALAHAARLRSVRCVVVLPSDAPPRKRNGIADEGADLLLYDRLTVDRRQLAIAEAQRRGMRLVEPYDDLAVIAGQGTAALELFEQTSGIDVLIAPLGGGGLLAGCGVALDGHGVMLVGAEPAAIPKGQRSLETGKRLEVRTPGHTIADALRSPMLGRLTFPLLFARAARTVQVTDAQLVDAMRFAAEELRLVCEASGVAALAAVLAGEPAFRGQRVGLILSGSNISLDDLLTYTRAGSQGGFRLHS